MSLSLSFLDWLVLLIVMGGAWLLVCLWHISKKPAGTAPYAARKAGSCLSLCNSFSSANAGSKISSLMAPPYITLVNIKFPDREQINESLLKRTDLTLTKPTKSPPIFSIKRLYTAALV